MSNFTGGRGTGASRYEDIINLPHPTSSKHPQMSMHDRAAQFAPFAALTGHSDAIDETARLTDSKEELQEDELAILDEKLQLIRESLHLRPQVFITYFVPDTKKSGGAYITFTGIVEKIDNYKHAIIMDDKRAISINDIRAMDISKFTLEL
jgi:hypothetical protein